MAGNLKYCISLLEDNDENVKKEAEQVLLKLCGNIIKNPTDSRYRKIRLANALVSTKLLPASGAIECLFEVGFIESDDGFMLPMNASLAGVKELFSLLDNILQSTSSQASKKPLPKAVEQSRPAVKFQKQENTFLLHLKAHFQSIMRYEDETLQSKVRSILPLEKLQISAMEKLREIQKEMKIKQISDDVVIEDLILTELLSWFKFKFFKWVDTLSCRNCTGECYNDGSCVSPDPRISRIEIHKCKSCGYENQFPRYTDPEALLYSRQGRCGEWANCFTLICRTVGFDARLVYDETDHVWTEIWSVAHNRWIHADACENLVDQPLIYEKGWGKKLSYVVAFSRDEIQDVTWRYTRDYEQVMRRRKHCSEEALALFLRKLNEEHQTSGSYSSARRKFVLRRSALELAEMLNAPPGHKKPAQDRENEADYGGRTSGSIAWRISRGEVHIPKLEPARWCIPEGVASFRLLYDIVNDTYTTIDTATGEILETRQKWQKGVERVEGAAIFRKDEPDWKMVYLARLPGSSEPSKVTWTFAVSDSSKSCVKSTKLQARAATFNGATVEWQIEALLLRSDGKMEQERRVLAIDDCQNFETIDLNGAIEISVSATLSGGTGELAWQHAQLFRQSLDIAKEEPSLLIQVELANRPQVHT